MSHNFSKLINEVQVYNQWITQAITVQNAPTLEAGFLLLEPAPGLAKQTMHRRWHKWVKWKQKNQGAPD